MFSSFCSRHEQKENADLASFLSMPKTQEVQFPAGKSAKPIP